MPRSVPIPPQMGQVAQGSDMERGSGLERRHGGSASTSARGVNAKPWSIAMSAFLTVSLRVVETAGPSMLA
jgi:hypothetical protein